MFQTVIKLKRTQKFPKYTIGELYVDGKKFCNTYEMTDRNINQQTENINDKIFTDSTAIPYGIYKIGMRMQLREFSVPRYTSWSGPIQFRVPYLEYVPGFGIITIHPKGTAFDTNGSISVGNWVNGKFINSENVFTALYNKLVKLNAAEIYIEIE